MREKQFSISGSFGFIEFGVAQSDVSDKLEEIYAAFGDEPTLYLDIGFFSNPDDVTQKTPGYRYSLHFNDKHPAIPQPLIVPFAAEFYFCSTQCMKEWFNRLIDRIDAARRGDDDLSDSYNPIE
jgi:hypothetical protein